RDRDRRGPVSQPRSEGRRARDRVGLPSWRRLRAVHGPCDRRERRDRGRRRRRAQPRPQAGRKGERGGLAAARPRPGAGPRCAGPSAGASGVIAISGGAYHTLVLKAGDTIPRCTVPQVVGTSLATAKRTIAASHCRIGKVSYAYSRRMKKGIVTAQSRRAGQVLAEKSSI